MTTDKENSRPKIMIVDDETIIAIDLKNTVEKLGYKVCAVANSGEAAIEEAEEKKPDLVLLDIILKGDMDGIEAAEKIHSSLEVPIVFLSAYADQDKLDRAKFVVPFGYVLKPYREDELKVAIEMALHISKVDTDRRLAEKALEEYRTHLESLVEKRTKELKDAEERFRRLVGNAPDIIFRWSTENGLEYISPAVSEITGYTPEELLEDPIKGFELATSISPDMIQTYEKGVSEGVSIPIPINPMITKDGRKIYLDIRSVPVKNREGEVEAFEGILRDVTDSVIAEEALKESEERFRLVFNNIASGILVTTFEGKIIMANPTALSLFGLSSKAVGDELGNWVTPAEELLTKEQLGRRHAVELQIADNRKLLFGFSNIKLELQDGEGLITIFQDLTDIKRSEEEHIKASKIESLGIMAGGIAHDFNNILTAIMIDASYAKSIRINEEVFHVLSDIETAALRARGLTQQLLTFSKGGTPVRKPVDFRNLIEESISLSMKGTNVESDLTFSENLKAADIDPDQILQVINNLIINACQAMPGGGTIKINADNFVKDKENSTPLEKGDYIRLIIEDHGAGISKDHLTKIFDPYFTTKSEGSGLGLSTAYSIIKNHGGLITVESKAGKGTSFTIYIPASEKDVSIGDSEESLVKGEGRILLVDDEEIILKSAGRMLQSIGYEVTQAQNGNQAVDLYLKAKESGRPIDIVIIDMIMPGGMDGKELIHKLKEIDSHVKAVVSSGYSHGQIMSDYESYGFSGVASKPYHSRELSELLSGLIKGKQYQKTSKEDTAKTSGSSAEKKSESILIVDDDKKLRESLQKAVASHGYIVRLAADGESALKEIRSSVPDLVLLDIQMPGMDGIQTFNAIRQIDSRLPVIIITGHGTTDHAIEATKLGAFEYILKPFELSMIMTMISKAIDAGRILKTNIEIGADPEAASGEAIIGNSDAIQSIFKAIGRVSSTDATVLIRGESGTGKELVARAIYQHSSRKGKPFKIINCAAIPETLLESELFGYEKGAFTSATYKRLGKLEQASGGTLFLDEIGDMPASIQAKVLRLLEEKSIERLGGRESIPVDVRIIAATNRDLESAIAEKRFREDLYYRLNVVSIDLPPLRNRKSDISLLCNYFLNKFSNEIEIPNPGISEQVMALFEDYAWPGNVRQLLNILHKALIFNQGYPVQPEDVHLGLTDQAGPPQADTPPTIIEIDDTQSQEKLVRHWLDENKPKNEDEDLLSIILNHVTKLAFKEVLKTTHNNRTKAAKLLGISRRTFYKKMLKCGLSDEDIFD